MGDPVADATPAATQAGSTVKGDTRVKNLRALVLKVLDKADQLLTTEPARMIGYGAAVVIYLAAKLLASRGIIAEPIDFNQSLVSAVFALGIVVGVVEGIRKFCYSPQTYIEDLADENKQGHLEAHMEEALKRLNDSMTQQVKAADAPAPEPGNVFVPTDGKSN